MIKRTLLGVAAAATALALTACGSSDSGSDSGKDSGSASGLKLVDDGTLTVCSDVPYAPFEDFDKSSPSGFKGFDIDIDSKIADALGLKLKVLDEDFDGLQSGLTLNAGTCDLVSSALTITDDRAKHLAFSDGYYDSKQSLLVPEGSSIAAIGDLKGKKVGVQKGTTGKDYANEHASGASVVDFPSDAEEFQALKAGQVDALLQDLPVNLAHEQAGGFKVVETYDTGEKYGLAAKKGNDALITAVNDALTKMRSDGSYDEIYNKYFATS
ncbi:amino acid ABC transporter substrate-binding protein, PAAT family (TC 3.A.1.3.-) [Nocardioides terrae]|uniref:Amino acid ABC transporter substrate-binding protein, PAAT family (TC 3.A.1.3.-) n=1 Tax=Nocardioides terrae TaxID=574651 RepID=A0A1I1G1D7_9ACTN|nr:ABC transporter substrate-binding protein [Nocardioides terrae]SFC03000.1 amino acid ABC transporter substrate-binding protein, PAAT family (TC 3.A.1.3.-) [Nocardioides terrae]